MQLEDDQNLAARMVAGEKRAFDEFFNLYFDRLYRFALVRVGHDSHAAEDVVQQTLCRAMQKIKLYKGEAVLFTWLCSICRNSIADLFRSKAHRFEESVPFEDSDEIRTALESLAMISEDDPQSSAMSQQIRHIVHVVLDHLPTRYGEVLALRYIEGYSTKEIAEAMDVGPKAAESLLGRARIAFRDAFATLDQSHALDGLAGESR